jgi:hypothetical protein
MSRATADCTCVTCVLYYHELWNCSVHLLCDAFMFPPYPHPIHLPPMQVGGGVDVERALSTDPLGVALALGLHPAVPSAHPHAGPGHGATSASPLSPLAAAASLLGHGPGSTMSSRRRAAAARAHQGIVQGASLEVGGGPVLVLYGHVTGVGAVTVCTGVGTVVSSSSVVLVHRLKDGRLLRTLNPWGPVWSPAGTASSVMHVSPLRPVGCGGSGVGTGGTGMGGAWTGGGADGSLEQDVGVRGFPETAVAVRPSCLLTLLDGRVVVAVQAKLMLFSAR